MQIPSNHFLPPSAAMPQAVTASPAGAAGRAPQDISGSLDAKLSRFWDGMLDTMEERTGVEAITHDRDRDRAYLAGKGQALRNELGTMPEGPGKQAALEKLDGFLQTNMARIESTYQRAMARETGAGPAFDETAFQAKMRMKPLA